LEKQVKAVKNMRIVIFGLGAIGSNLLLTLAKLYPKMEFIGVDYDKVEERNLNTQAYLIPHVGHNKVLSMQAVLGLNLKSFKYISKNLKVTSVVDLSFLNANDIVIDCFDNARAREIVYEYASTHNYISCIHIGFSPQYTAEFIWNDKYTVPADIPEDQLDICSMDQAIPFINFVVSVSAFSIKKFVDNQVKNNFLVTNVTKIINL
jgi:molybdopterin/thiamine biosynthesis adenylyltransferase